MDDDLTRLIPIHPVHCIILQILIPTTNAVHPSILRILIPTHYAIITQPLFIHCCLGTFVGPGIGKEPAAAPDLVGKWRKEAGLTWEFQADRTYTVALGDGKTSVSGKYTLAGNQFTVVDESATGMAGACPAEEKGVYKFTLKDKTLEVTSVSDPCTGRSEIAAGTYTRE
jgi:hypothetical protein